MRAFSAHVGDVKEIELMSYVASVVAPGTVSRGPLTLSLSFAHDALGDAERSFHQSFTTVRVMKKVGALYTKFECRVIGSDEPKSISVVMPLDRRQARRVSRRTGLKFRWRNGEPHFA